MPRREPFRQQLLAFDPADRAEAEHHRRMLTLLDTAGDPFSRGHFTPGHFTASAFVLSPAADSLLLIFHSKLHRWLQPGGHVDAGDRDLQYAARREVLEETGLNIQHPTFNIQHPSEDGSGVGRWSPRRLPSQTLNVECWMLRSDPFDLDIHPIPANPRKAEPAHEHFDVRFLFIASDLAHVAGSDATEARWVPLGQITAELTDASVMRAVRKLRTIRDEQRA